MKIKTITLYNFSELSEQALQDENDYVSDIEHIKEYFKECDFYDWYEDGTLYTERK